MQNDLRMAKEKARRKQVIIGRQEEELAAREASLDSMRKDQASSSRQTDHLQEDNQALKVSAASRTVYNVLRWQSVSEQLVRAYASIVNAHC